MDELNQVAQRILKIQKESKLDRKSFCEKLGISPAILSHISSGRNNPSLELIHKILKQYADINIEWLLMGKGKMKNSGENQIEIEKPEKEKEYIEIKTEKKKEVIENKDQDNKSLVNNLENKVEVSVKKAEVPEIKDVFDTNDNRFKLMLLSYLIDEHSKQYKNLTTEILQELNKNKRD